MSPIFRFLVVAGTGGLCLTTAVALAGLAKEVEGTARVTHFDQTTVWLDAGAGKKPILLNRKSLPEKMKLHEGMKFQVMLPSSK